MTAIQAIHIRDWEDRSEPKPHIVYRIEIQASVRSWQMWHRYSEFVDLHVELMKSTKSPPPAPLPPKHALKFFRSATDSTLLEERRAGLEAYLRAILSAREDIWRESFAFRDFLGVPVGKQDVGGGGYGQFTPSSWLEELQDVQARVRDVRANIDRRNALANNNDVSASHQANVEAKKILAGVLTRVGTLESGLQELGMAGMGEGELQRRSDLVARLRDDCEKLAQIVTVARTTLRGIGTATERSPASPNCDALFGSSLSNTMAGSSSRPVARVFGQAPQQVETEQTRPLDDRGLVQLQQTQIIQQDAQLAQLSTILKRHKQLGLAINQEIREQNEELDVLTVDVDRVGGKLTSAKRQINRLG